jgi:hypothetical protein
MVIGEPIYVCNADATLARFSLGSWLGLVAASPSDSTNLVDGFYNGPLVP